MLWSEAEHALPSLRVLTFAWRAAIVRPFRTRLSSPKAFLLSYGSSLEYDFSAITGPVPHKDQGLITPRYLIFYVTSFMSGDANHRFAFSAFSGA